MLPLLPIRQLGARSSILLHSYPSFYACYLLKSIQIPQPTPVYIGSTPSPPRRIRQHNGEITAGARKTQKRRPWVMQMIVHGFPSRLAALQFEWAWQHAYKSRHMRDANGRVFGERRCRDIKRNIAIVRSMVARQPFNTWSLHVKLFTEEAVNYWNASERLPNVPPLPPGLMYSIELEGVDGKSGHPGSGREGPMAADDDEFTASLLAKNTALIDSGRALECSVCKEPLHTYDSDPLSTTLCPSTGCMSTAHIVCLSKKFITEEGAQSTELIPRGGHCDLCSKYTLWGDIVRGCYRRTPPVNSNNVPDIASDDMFLTDEDLELYDTTPRKRKSSSPSSRVSTSKRRTSHKLRAKLKTLESTEGESFDFDGIMSSSSETPMKRKPERQRKSDSSLSEKTPKAPKKQGTVPSSSSLKVKPKPTKSLGSSITHSAVSSEGESFDFDNILSSSDSEPSTAIKQSCSKPRKIVTSTSAVTISLKTSQLGSESAGAESFDLDNAASSSGIDSETPVKRKRGRPRKSDNSLPQSIEPTASAKIPKTRKPRSAPSSSSLKVKPKPNKLGKFATEASTTLSPAVSSGGETFDFDDIISSSDSEPATPTERSRGRPRKPVAFTAPVNLSRIVSQPATTRTEAATAATSSSVNDAIPAGKPRPRNEGEIIVLDSSFDLGNDSAIVPLKRKPGRPRKDAAAMIPGAPEPSDNAKAKANMSPSPGRLYHTSTSAPANIPRGAPSSSGSGSDVEILPYVYLSSKKGRSGGVLNNPTPITTTPSRRAVRPTYPPNVCLDETLEYAMANLSVATPSQLSKKHKTIEVIELSD